jgi:hypothetical protein
MNIDKNFVLKTILSSSTLAANITSTKISTKGNFRVPKFFPLPPQVKFLYPVGISIYSPSLQKTMDVSLNPFEISTNKSFVTFDTSVDLLPVNTEAAADALASIANPLLSATPKVNYFACFFTYYC